MQHKLILVCSCTFILVGMQRSTAQNLVPNGSFEQYTYCPDYWNQIDGNVSQWSLCGGSPDYFNECRDSSDFGVPFNWRGYQFALDGSAYIGLTTFKQNGPMFREYACASLDSPLNIGDTIFLSMRIAMGGWGSYAIMSPKWTTRGTGMLLSTTPFIWPQSQYLDTAHLYMENVLLDSVNWTLLSGAIVVDSLYQYVALGNFFNDSLSAPVVIDPEGGTPVAYVYVDDVCVSTSPLECSLLTGTRNIHSTMEWSIVSPFHRHLHIRFDNPLPYFLDMKILDAGGRLMKVATIEKGASEAMVDSGNLPDGFYTVLGVHPNGVLRPIKVMHVSP